MAMASRHLDQTPAVLREREVIRHLAAPDFGDGILPRSRPRRLVPWPLASAGPAPDRIPLFIVGCSSV